jgi:hypothetical protein
MSRECFYLPRYDKHRKQIAKTNYTQASYDPSNYTQV